MAKRSSIGGLMRKKLSDISNLPVQPKLPFQFEKPPENLTSNKDCIEQLLKERAALMQLVTEKDKIIEWRGAEMQRLQVNIQKLQLQNWTLAQSNSQMLAELNLSREKLKTLQHEVVCKTAIIKEKNSKAEGKVQIGREMTVSQSQGGEDKPGQLLPIATDDEKPCTNRRRTSRSQSMGPTTTRKGGNKGMVENNKRQCVRKSARFEAHEHEHMENLFEIEDVKLPLLTEKPKQEPETLPNSLAILKNENEENSSSGNEVSRSSIGRPMRKAAVKVQSYKEIPLNVKMRRQE